MPPPPSDLEPEEPMAVRGFLAAPAPPRSRLAQAVRRAPLRHSPEKKAEKGSAAAAVPRAAPARVRTKFPETWIWADLSTG